MTGTGAPWPSLPLARGPHEVLALGDSIMGNAVWALTQPGWYPDITVRDEHRNGSGLTSGIFEDDAHGLVSAEVFVEHMLAKWPHADTAIVAWEGACKSPCPTPYGSPAWYARWWTQIGNVEQILNERFPGRIVWAIAPPAPPSGPEPGAVYEYTQTVSDALSWQGRSAIDQWRVDWWTAAMGVDSFLGHYEQRLNYSMPWPSPSTQHQVRADDLVHFTPDGAFRLGWWVMATLRTMWG